MRVTIVGGSLAGLVTAMLLARAGHQVEVLERDPRPHEPGVEAAAEVAFRAAAPQIVQPHMLLAKGRELLREHLPDVLDALLEAGVVEASLTSQMPPSLPDRSVWPGDERLGLLLTRRSTIDWVLRRCAAAEPGVTLRWGVRVSGLLAEPGDPPTVTGVVTRDGAEPADLVVDASGRRTPLDAWLSAIGAQPSAMTAAECGHAYYSRHFRMRDRDALPGLPTTRTVAALDEFTIGIWGGDHDTMVIALAPLVADARFRAVRDADVWTAVVRSVPYYAGWLDALDPISDVYAMGGLHNTLRRLVVDGAPVVLGLHPVGDVVCTTNPTMGRGMSVAVHGGVDLVEVLAAHPDDRHAQALALDTAIGTNVLPFYADQAVIDAARLDVLRHTVLGRPVPPAEPLDPDRVSYAQLRAAAPHDPHALRGFWTVMGMLRPPEEVYRDPEIVARVHRVLATSGGPPRMAQPTHEELTAALTAGSAATT